MGQGGVNHVCFTMTGHCLITGGAGAMGAAVAKLAAQQGYAVSLLSLAAEEPVAARLVQDIQIAGGKAQFIVADVAREADVVAAYQQAAETFGGANRRLPRGRGLHRQHGP